MAKCVIKTTSKPLHINSSNRSSGVPQIVREFYEGETRYYETSDGKTYDAHIYDANFKFERKTIRKRNYKGTSTSLKERTLRVNNDLKKYARI